MSFSVDDCESFRPELEAEVTAHCIFPVQLLFVPDIAEWASTRTGNLAGNPIAMAVRDGVTNGAVVLLRQSITQARVESVLGRIELGDTPGAREILCSPRMFMRHLVLHELAHLVNDWRQDDEDSCDAWAFERLGAKL